MHMQVEVDMVNDMLTNLSNGKKYSLKSLGDVRRGMGDVRSGMEERAWQDVPPARSELLLALVLLYCCQRTRTLPQGRG